MVAENPDITIPLLDGKLKNKTTESFDFTSSTSLEFSQAVGETTTLSLTGPTEDYQGCTAIQVYQDNFYGSLAFACAPIPTFGFTLPSPSRTVVRGSNETDPISTQTVL